MTMNKLVISVRKILFKKNDVGLRLPAIFGMLIGGLADFISKIIRKNLSVSSIRVKKFLSTTQFSSSIDKTGFVAPFTLEDGLKKTLVYEFIEDNKDKITYETE